MKLRRSDFQISKIVAGTERAELDHAIYVQRLLMKANLTGVVDYEAGVSTWRSNLVRYSRRHHRRYRIKRYVRLSLALAD